MPRVSSGVGFGGRARLADVEAARDDVLCVLEGEAVALLELEVLPQELLVVGHLHHQHALEHVLQVRARVRVRVRVRVS